jgi:hypothetical protein
MEYWKNGMVEYWNDGRFEEWNSGILEYWNKGPDRIPVFHYSSIPTFQSSVLRKS